MFLGPLPGTKDNQGALDLVAFDICHGVKTHANSVCEKEGFLIVSTEAANIDNTALVEGEQPIGCIEIQGQASTVGKVIPSAYGQDPKSWPLGMGTCLEEAVQYFVCRSVATCDND